MTPVAVRREVCSYGAPDGSWPFEEWLRGLLDAPTRARLFARIIKIGEGSFDDFKGLDGGIYEARIHFGPGWRLYFGLDGHDVVFLCGGTKGTQDRDIKKARSYWIDYENSKSEKKKKLKTIH